MFLSYVQKQTIVYWCQQYGVNYCLLFGSFASGIADAKSDIDLLVNTVPRVVELQRTLRAALGIKFDIVVSPTPELVWGFGVSERLI